MNMPQKGKAINAGGTKLFRTSIFTGPLLSSISCIIVIIIVIIVIIIIII